MKTVQIGIDKNGKPMMPKGRTNLAQINATTDHDILQHQRTDDAEALMGAAKTLLEELDRSAELVHIPLN
jgi:hypothetical protein